MSRAPAGRILATGAASVLLAGSAAPVAAQAQGPPLLVGERVDHLDTRAAREPMLVEHPQGTLFVAGYSRAPEEAADPPNLWASRDGGRSWASVDVGTAADGAVGNSDVDLAVAPDGTLYFLTMGFDRTTGRGTHVAVGVSRDVGASWSWTDLSRTTYDDRPWIAVDERGAAHVVWNDSAGVSYAVSRDGGRTWSERPRVALRGGSSHLAAGPAGRLAVRITPAWASGNFFDPEVDSIALSHDGGGTWEAIEPPGERRWQAGPGEADPIPRWVEPLAWDRDGALWHLWSEGHTLRLGRRLEGGTWETWTVASSDAPLFYPFLVAGPEGELAATWFSGTGEALRAHVALIEPGGEGLRIHRSDALPVGAFRRDADGARVPDPAGEYVPVAFLADGDLAVVLPIQDAPRGEGFTFYRLGR